MRLHLHLISDSTGDTVTSVTRAAVSQFDGVTPVEHVWFFIRTEAQLERVFNFVDALPGIVVFTLVEPHLRDRLVLHCGQRGVPCVPVLDGLIDTVSHVVGATARQQAGRKHVLDEGYFSRIEAMNFVMRHDDGQQPDKIYEADVIVLGVSRTSKTPTCMYLANRGIKAANIPLVPERPPLVDFSKLKANLVVGLSIQADQLVQIRLNRQRMLGMDRLGGGVNRFGGDYAELDRVREELRFARRLYSEHGWPVIDVTRRSVEETAAAIYQLYQERRNPDLRTVLVGDEESS
ncbi:MAG: kinase/pyrophosphorylase [Geminicoccaceae bacterium]|nr:MAG: kinase/pyrophosphorylase [Geminicoccaceae bacterium]